MNAPDLTRRVIRSSVDWSGAGLRLDQYLAGRFTYRAIDEWRQRIAGGEILLNDRVVPPETTLELHDKIEYFPGDLPEPEADLRYDVVYEDEFLLAVSKPGNLCVHPSGPFFKHTLWHMLSLKYGRIHLVNRLDRETSGLLLVAKTAAVAAKLGSPRYPIQKEYLALVFGTFPGECDAKGFLVPDETSMVRKKRRFVPGDRPPSGAIHPESCRTRFRAEQCSERFSLVRAFPETGRLHQIRATLFSLGFPLVGDKLYGPDERIYLKIRSGGITPEERAALILPRQALHAERLRFPHPVTGAEIVAESPPPPEFKLPQ